MWAMALKTRILLMHQPNPGSLDFEANIEIFKTLQERKQQLQVMLLLQGMDLPELDSHLQMELGHLAIMEL